MLSFSLFQKAALVFYLGNAAAKRSTGCYGPSKCFDEMSSCMGEYSSVSNDCRDQFKGYEKCETEFIKITETIGCETKCVTPCVDICEITYFFSHTCAYKFTLCSYEAILSLLFPRDSRRCKPDNKCFDFYKPSKRSDVETKVYLLLLHVLKTIPPTVYDLYAKYFYSERYFECFLVLQRIFSPEAELERIIIESIFCKNRCIRKKCPTCICFVDPCTKECSVVEFPTCDPKSRICLYLPKQILCFEEFLCTSFYLDELILAELDHFTGCEFRQVFTYLLKLYYRNFHKLSYEARIIFFLRIKFFAFNAIGYSISHLCSGPKIQIRTLLIETAQCTNDVFYRSYAIGLGLLK